MNKKRLFVVLDKPCGRVSSYYYNGIGNYKVIEAGEDTGRLQPISRTYYKDRYLHSAYVDVDSWTFFDIEYIKYCGDDKEKYSG